ncbi:MAG: sigma-70 family RNA polymerase sigma factor [bacterium]|nr:sigma-70 family RNA polymerase sigma factor [bacterium]
MGEYFKEPKTTSRRPREDSLAYYVRLLNRYPILSAEEEVQLIENWLEREDRRSADRVVTSHMRLVVKLAWKYRRYQLPLPDLISEGALGLLEGLKRFDPEKGFRFSTYAVWWVHARMKEYILHNWSLVKIGTTRAQKKLFFSLRRLKRNMDLYSSAAMTPEQLSTIAEEVGVSEKSVMHMDRRLRGKDYSLNAPLGSEEGEDSEWIDRVEDETANPEDRAVYEDRQKKAQDFIAKALDLLKPREADIIHRRHLSESPMTLEALGAHLGISRERVRQIESVALSKLKSSLGDVVHSL